MRVLKGAVIDLETTTKDPDEAGVWYAAVVFFEIDENLRLKVLGQRTLFYHLPAVYERSLSEYWEFDKPERRGEIIHLKEVEELKKGSPVTVRCKSGEVRITPVGKYRGTTVFEEEEFFKELFRKADLIVAHNAEYESRLLARITPFLPFTFCTMRFATPVLRIPHKKYGYKFPTLEEACEGFGVRELVDGNTNFHDALYDARATLELFVRELFFLRKVKPSALESLFNLSRSKDVR